MGGFLGAALGWPLIAVNLYFTYLLGGLVAAYLIISRKYKSNARLPFAPLLGLGALLALWLGPDLVALVRSLWYGAF
jgi:prepilin signal peptidase PulO-like enzyme (type II secretory pathway)